VGLHEAVGPRRKSRPTGPEAARAMEALRSQLAKAGLAAVDRFAPQEIMDRWEAVLRRVTDRAIALREIHSSAQPVERP
jgi:hypothetical protein